MVPGAERRTSRRHCLGELAALAATPWLRAAQFDAAEAHGTAGWMLWNEANRHDADGLRAKEDSP